jgi:hypothetical protein
MFGWPIRWDLTLTLAFGINQVKYTVEGCKTEFPAFEIYGNHQAMLEATDGGNVRGLMQGCAASVSTNGVIR